MRHVFLVSTVILATTLACGGMTGTSDAPPADQGGEEPAAAALAPLDVADATPIVIAELAVEGEGCAWRASRFPGHEEVGMLVRVAECPTAWVGSAQGERAVLLSATGGAARIGGAAQVDLPAPPVAPEAVAG